MYRRRPHFHALPHCTPNTLPHLDSPHPHLPTSSIPPTPTFTLFLIPRPSPSLLLHHSELPLSPTSFHSHQTPYLPLLHPTNYELSLSLPPNPITPCLACLYPPPHLTSIHTHNNPQPLPKFKFQSPHQLRTPIDYSETSSYTARRLNH